MTRTASRATPTRIQRERTEAILEEGRRVRRQASRPRIAPAETRPLVISVRMVIRHDGDFAARLGAPLGPSPRPFADAEAIPTGLLVRGLRPPA